MKIPTVNCTFENTYCGYSVSNSSTSFAFSYVFSISSLGELMYIAVFVAAVCVRCTEYSVADYADDDDENVNLFPVRETPTPL